MKRKGIRIGVLLAALAVSAGALAQTTTAGGRKAITKPVQTVTLKKSSQTLLAADSAVQSTGYCIDNQASGSSAVTVYVATSTAAGVTQVATTTNGRALAPGGFYCEDAAGGDVYYGIVTVIAASTSGAPVVQAWRLP